MLVSRTCYFVACADCGPVPGEGGKLIPRFLKTSSRVCVASIICRSVKADLSSRAPARMAFRSRSVSTTVLLSSSPRSNLIFCIATSRLLEIFIASPSSGLKSVVDSLNQTKEMRQRIEEADTRQLVLDPGGSDRFSRAETRRERAKRT